MRTLLLAVSFLAFFAAASFASAQGFNDFERTFQKFARHYNPWITPNQAHEQAIACWVISPPGEAKFYRSAIKAALGAQESRFRIWEYLPADVRTAILARGEYIGRTDCYGSHYNLLAKELRDKGMFPGQWRFHKADPDWLDWKETLKSEPFYGSWLALGRFEELAGQCMGAEGAVRCWQSGTCKPSASGDEHLRQVQIHLARFYKMLKEVSRPTRAANQRRKL